jgi:outer membrane protein assembly factor BamB
MNRKQKWREIEMKKIYFQLTIVSMLIAAFTPNVVFGLYPTAVPWLMDQHDIARTGTTTSTAPGSNATLWSYTAVSGVKTPIVVDGKVIFSASSKVFALDETTGVKTWETVSFASSFTTSPTYADGKLYAGVFNGILYCIDPTTGAKLWEYDASPGQIQTSPAVYSGKVFFGTTDNYLYALNSTTGLYIWRVDLGGAVYSSPAVDGDIVYVGCDNDRLYAINHTVTPFAQKWFYPVNSRIRTPPVLAYGMVFFSCGSGSSLGDHAVFALNATEGSLIWKYTIGTTYGFENALAVSGNTVYCAPSSSDTIYALKVDAPPGNYSETDPTIRLWSRTLAYYLSDPVVAGDRVFLSAATKLYALYTSDGQINWTSSFTYASGTPIIADDRLFITESTKVHCFGSPYPPVTYHYAVHAGGSDFDVMLVINATPSEFNTTGLETLHTLSYKLEGIASTTGMSEITIPKAMMLGPYTVTVDNFAPTTLETKVDNATHTVLYLTYPHSAHTVVITGFWTIPEYSQTILLPLLLTTLLLVTLVLTKKKQPKN